MSGPFLPWSWSGPEKKLSVVHCWVHCWLCVFYIWLICWVRFLLFLVCWVFFFFKKRVKFCQIFFLYYLRWSFFFLSFILFMWLIIIDQFSCVEPSLQSRNKSHLVMVYNPFNMLPNMACCYFVEDFCISFHKGFWFAVFL